MRPEPGVRASQEEREETALDRQDSPGQRTGAECITRTGQGEEKQEESDNGGDDVLFLGCLWLVLGT